MFKLFFKQKSKNLDDLGDFSIVLFTIIKTSFKGFFKSINVYNIDSYALNHLAIVIRTMRVGY